MSSWNKLKEATIGSTKGALAGGITGVAGAAPAILGMNKKNSGINKTISDPFNMGWGDAIFGKSKGPDYSQYEADQAAAIAAQRAAYEEFIAGGGANYETGAPLSFEEFVAGNPLAFEEFQRGDQLNYETLSPDDLARLGPSSFDDIRTDPRFADAELSALSSLEERANGSGLTLQDEADTARLNSQVNTQNRGRLGAIRENMASRGMSGSGMDLLAQLQASQDATELQAYQSLEQAAQAQNQKRQAAIDAGSMGSRLRGQAFQEDAAKAQARDEINRFNTSNMVNLQNRGVDIRNQAANQNWERANSTSDRNTSGRNDVNSQNWQRTNATNDRNTSGRNDTTSANWQRTNATSDRNAGAAYDYRRDKLNAGTGQSERDYNYSVDQENRRRMGDAQSRQGVMDKFGNVTGAIGAVVGGVKGGPAGAQAGYGVGKGVGGAVGGTAYDNGYRYYAHGGLVQGDDYSNDQIPAMVSEDEIIIPRSISDDPVKSSEFVAEANGEEMDAVGHLLAAMQLMNRGRR